MREAFPGYYQKEDSSIAALWDTAIFSFDTNALLNAYRFSANSRELFLSILHKLRGHAWLPHRVADEYHRKLRSEIDGQAQKAKGSELRSSLDSFSKQIEKFRHHPTIDKAELDAIYKTAKTALDNLVQAAATNDYLTTAEATINRIAEIFSKRIGQPYSVAELKQKYEDAAMRYEDMRPPGYRDSRKEGNLKYGDALIWFQLLDYAKATKKEIVFVTDDEKDDWWDKSDQKPRAELTTEMLLFAGVKFHIFTSAEFLEQAGEMLKTENRTLTKAIDELEEITEERYLEEDLETEFLIRSLDQAALNSTADKVFDLIIKAAGLAGIDVSSHTPVEAILWKMRDNKNFSSRDVTKISRAWHSYKRFCNGLAFQPSSEPTAVIILEMLHDAQVLLTMKIDDLQNK